MLIRCFFYACWCRGISQKSHANTFFSGCNVRGHATTWPVPFALNVWTEEETDYSVNPWKMILFFFGRMRIWPEDKWIMSLVFVLHAHRSIHNLLKLVCCGLQSVVSSVSLRYVTISTAASRTCMLPTEIPLWTVPTLPFTVKILFTHAFTFASHCWMWTHSEQGTATAPLLLEVLCSSRYWHWRTCLSLSVCVQPPLTRYTWTFTHIPSFLLLGPARPYT